MLKTHKKPLLVAMSGLLLAAFSGHSSANTEQEEPIETIVVTASAGEVYIKNAPASISIITADDISKIPSADLNEVLRKVPGLSQTTTTDGGTSIQVRGLEQKYTLILIDGKRAGSSSDTFDRYERNELNWIAPESIERIEVVRGSMSSLYGSDAMGGVINIITKKTKQEWAGSVTLGSELNEESIRGNDYMGSFFVGGSLTDSVKLRLNGSQTYQQPDSGLPEGTTSFRFGGGREGAKRQSLGGQLSWDINKDHNLAVDFSKGEWKTLNGPSPTTSNPGATATSTRGPAKMKNENLALSYAGKHDFGTSRAAVTYSKYDNKTSAPIIENGALVPKLDENGEPVFSRGSPVYVTRDAQAISKDLVIDGSVNIPFTFGVDQKLTVGTQWQKNELDNPNSVGNSPNADGVVGLSYNERRSIAFFAEDTLFLADDLELTLGLRHDDYDDSGSHLSPRAYLVYHPSENWTVRGGYSEGFRAPTLRQSNPNFVSVSAGAGCRPGTNPGGGCNTRGNSDLKPETTQSFELGVSWDSGLWKAGLTFFNIDFENKIDVSSSGQIIGNVLWQDYVNVTSAETQGLEANFSMPLFENTKTAWLESLVWSTNATHMLESRNKENDQPLSATPEWSGSTSLDWEINKKFNLNIGAELIGKQYGLEKLATGFGDSRIATSYVLYNLGANYQINSLFRINMGVKNLTDKDPNGTSEEGNNFYTLGRRYFVSLTSQF